MKFLREENNTKNCIIQTLLENQKYIQNTPDSRTLDINSNELKSAKSFHSTYGKFVKYQTSSLNRVPCVPAYQRGLRANVLACQRDLRANVPTCQRVKSVPSFRFYLPTCQITCKAWQCFNLAC